MLKWRRTGRGQSADSGPALAGAQAEMTADLRSLQEWDRFRAEHPAFLDPAWIDAFGRSIIANGCTEPLTAHQIEPGALEESGSWREGLSYRGLPSRGRAVLQVIGQMLEAQAIASPTIYMSEAVTPFASRIRGLFPRSLGSEYSTDPEKIDWFYPIPCEDLQRLTLRSDAFDIVSTNDVLEHVPSIDAALSEICRVLRPGGWHVGTVPFHFTKETGVRHAKLEEDGSINHLVEPEYHGDPIGGRALVFELAGWDIIDRAIAAGFSRAFMRFVTSARFGVVAEHIGGVFVFCCRK